MSVKEDLIAMRKLLTPKHRWCKGAAFKNSEGWPVLYADEADSMCVMGATVVVGRIVHSPRRMALVKAIQQALNTKDVAIWNDAKGRTHKDILALLDRCIADCDPKEIPAEIWYKHDIPEYESSKITRELEPA